MGQPVELGGGAFAVPAAAVVCLRASLLQLGLGVLEGVGGPIPALLSQLERASRPLGGAPGVALGGRALP